MKPKGPYKLSKQPKTPRYLVICDGGNVRSAAIATTLKLDYGREAIAVGRLYMSPKTMTMLTDWADVIVLTQEHMIGSVINRNKHKCLRAELGQDRWGVFIHPELNSLADQAAKWLVEKEGQR